MENFRSEEIYQSLSREVLKHSPGALLPSVSAMKRRWKAGQSTLMKVLDRLEREGKITRRRRVGILVAHPQTEVFQSPARRPVDAFSPWVRTSPTTITCLASLIEERALWEDLVAAFHHAHGKFRVALEFLPDHEIIRRLEKPHPPMLVELCSGPDFYERVWEGNLFQDLSIFLLSLGPSSLYYDAALVRDNSGRVVAVTPLLIAEIAFANRRLLEQASLELPSRKWGWEELPHLTREARKRLPQVSPWGYLIPGYAFFFMRCGVELVDPKTNKITLDTPVHREVLRLLRRLICKERVMPLCSDLPSESTIYRDFVEGKALMAQGFSYLLEDGSLGRRLEKMELAFAMTPSHPRGRPIISGPILCLDAASHYYEEGWELLRFILSEEGQRLVAKYRAYAPVLKSVPPGSPRIHAMGHEAASSFVRVMQQSASDGQFAYLDGPVLFRVLHVIESVVDRWLRFSGDLDQALAQAEQRCNQLIGKSTP